MKKTISFLAVALALCVATQNVNADDETTTKNVFTVSVETAGNDLGYWTVANVTPNQYTNGTTKFNKRFLNFDNETGLSGIAANKWGTVKPLANNQLGANWANNDNDGYDPNSNWITPATSVTSGSSQAHNANGFYAYRLLFDAKDTGDFWAEFSATIYADDFVVGIFLNGVELAIDQVKDSQYSSWNIRAPISFDYETGIPVHETGNELIIVVHNNNSNNGNSINATGLNAIVDIVSNTSLTITNPNDEDDIKESEDLGDATGTPEPATMLILGLGTLGAGLYGRRRVKK